MELLTNPVLVSVLVLCILCLCKLNVLMSLIIASMVGALMGGFINGLPEGGIMEVLTGAMGTLTGGFANNANTALSYVLLGTFATAIASNGLADILAKKLSKIMGGKGKMMLLILAFIACFSQNLVPVHIAFIPILVPPLLSLMNDMKIDRRGAACALAFGLKAPYISIPFGFGSIFMGIIADNMTQNGMAITIGEVAKYNWMLGACMLLGLLLAVFVTYAKPREYKNLAVNTEESDAVSSDKLTYAHWVTIAAIIIVVVVEANIGLLALSALIGLLVMFVGQAIKWNDIDKQFEGGIKIMGMIAIIMLVAGGYADVMKSTGAVETLVDAAVAIMGGNKIIAATVITLIGLLVTMGIGSSFSTVPVLAILYVPMCQQMGFSVAATAILMSAAAALGDAGSPASDTTLGPTSGLNADGQHDHIWDTCVPTFIHYNIPLMVGAILISQFI